ncbi:MAG: DUF1064 domain-containing protein [Shinella sp.]|nr:DUF1064 domain-containing protein [Shinella sp.]
MTETLTASQYLSMQEKKKNKYGAKKTVVDGIRFDSKAEAKHYHQLKLLEMAGEISGVELQVPFAITIGGFLICTYRADFVYHDRDKRRHVVDCKGVRTKDYIIKKKLMHAVLGIEIEEVRA